MMGVLLLLVCAACGGEPSDGSRDGSASAAQQAPKGGEDLISRALPRFLQGKDGPFPAPSARMLRAQQALARGDGRAGRLILEEEVSENPSNGEATLILSEMLMNKGQFGAARDGLERVLDQGPTFPRSEQVFLLYGRCLMRLGEGERARASLEAFDRLSPGGGDTQWVLGMLDLQEGRPEEALSRFEAALAAYRAKGRPRKDRARIHAGRADAYLQQNELEKARAALEACTRMDPSNPQTHYALSRVLTRIGDTEGAERALQAFARAKAAAGAGRKAPGDARPPDGKRRP